MDRGRYARHATCSPRLLVYILSRSVSQTLPLHVDDYWMCSCIYFYIIVIMCIWGVKLEYMVDTFERLSSVDETEQHTVLSTNATVGISRFSKENHLQIPMFHNVYINFKIGNFFLKKRICVKIYLLLIKYNEKFVRLNR